jgi:hypothetical protein
MARIVSLLEQALSFYPHHKWDPCKSFREEADQNWKIEPTPIVFKKYWLCLIMSAKLF